MKPFIFENQMRMSEGAGNEKDNPEIIRSCFPNAVVVERATTSDDRNGTDYWATMQSGQKISIDLKARAKDCISKYGEDDLALETWSVIGKKVGWTRDVHKRTDYIFFRWKDTGRWVLIPFPMLCSIFAKNWEAWRKKYKTRIQPNKNLYGSYWESECVFVPRVVVWREIYATFGGTPI